ncbi:MAG: transcriptional regulator, partial [Gammaproteobacteria bacterium]
MSKLDEIYRLHRLLDGRRTGIARAALIGEHGFARATLARLIADLRNKLGAPLIHDSERGGYRYDTADGSHALPGLWFNPAELLALVTLKHLLAKLEPGLLDDHLRPLEARLDKLLASQHLGAGEAAQRIRLLSIAARRKNPRHFQAVAHA